MFSRTENQAGRRLRPTLSMTISLLALVIAMSTGAYAATTAAKNSVISKSIKNGQVKTKDVADVAITGAKLRDDSVSESKLTDGSVSSPTIRDGGVEASDLSAAARTELTRAASTAYSTHFEVGVPVPTVPTNVATLTLPPGSYVLTSKAQIDTFNNTDIVECVLIAFSGSDQSFVQGADVHESNIIGNSLVATLPGAGPASLRCQTFGGGIISQVRLTAVSVNGVTNQP